MSRSRSNDPPKSAAELMAELQQDPEYIARTRQREQQQRKNTETYARAVAPVLKDLAAEGFRVSTIGELRQSKLEYRSAVAILLQWLPQISDLQVKEDIVRTLSVPWARPEAAQTLIEEFKRADDATAPGLRWVIANGLAIVADDSVFDELVQLVEDRGYGKAREMLALALSNVRNPQAIGVLMGLLDDEQMVGHAVMALGKLNAAEAQSRLRDLTRHPTEWVREEARKSLAIIEGSALH